MHIRYTPETFLEDLMFQETKDRQNFQTCYVLAPSGQGRPRGPPNPEAKGSSGRGRPSPGAGACAPGQPHRRRHRRHPAQTDPPPAPTQKTLGGRDCGNEPRKDRKVKSFMGCPVRGAWD